MGISEDVRNRNSKAIIVMTLLQPLIVVTASLLLAGCTKSLDGAIEKCNDEASRAVVGQLPTNEFEKEHLRVQEQGFFFRCMKAAGFNDSQRHVDRIGEMIRRNNPNISTEQFLKELNEITQQTMRDPKSDHWTAK